MVDIDGGTSLSTEATYPHGVLTYPGCPEVARQDADDYLECLDQLLSWAASQGDVIGIGIDATASTPIPVDASHEALSRRMPNERNALAWLWKDHAAQAEADEITEFLRAHDPTRLARVGKYYAEWFWAKALRCARESPAVFDAAHTWLEQCDFLTLHLTGEVTRGASAAGHKALYHSEYPASANLARIDPRLVALRETIQSKALPCSVLAGGLIGRWNLPPGIPVAVGGVDAHSGAVGAGIREGRLCMVLGTSACHMAVAPHAAGIAGVHGISGIADDSILPGMLGLEAGQAAFGDLLNWVGRQAGVSQAALSHEAETLPVGANGLLTVDFHAGNRCPLADAALAGATFGQTLQTTHAEIYRSAVEALAMGVRQIVGLMTSAGVEIHELLACGGVATKNRFVLQTIADVTGKPVLCSETQETCALGAAIFGAVVGGVFDSAEEAQSILCRVSENPILPDETRRNSYSELFELWAEVQNEMSADSGPVKRLLCLRSGLL